MIQTDIIGPAFAVPGTGPDRFDHQVEKR